jgi:4a-hydroxytetrahydrobiopterin dehydratase
MPSPLAPEAIAEALQQLPGWNYHDHSLHKRFQFLNFREAISFLVRLSFEAETLNHHPEIHSVYNTVNLTLTTHDAGNQVTELDLSLARAIENFNWLQTP